MPSAISKQEQSDNDKRRRAQEAILAVDLQTLLVNPAFLRFFGDLLEMCDPMGYAFSLNGSETNYTLGQQEVGKMLWKLLQKHKAESLPQVLKAWNSLEETKDAD